MTTSTSAITSTGPTNATTPPSSQLADNQFLLLLTEQLKHQTPLEPVDNESFMNQMASYTTMEEQRTLNSNMSKLLDYQTLLARAQGLSQGSALLGKEVTFADASGQEHSGTVESIYVDQSGTVRMRLTGDQDIDMNQVTGIAAKADA